MNNDRSFSEDQADDNIVVVEEVGEGGENYYEFNDSDDYYGNGDDGEEEEKIDWQDGGVSDDDHKNDFPKIENTTALPRNAVTVDFGKPNDDNVSSKSDNYHRQGRKRKKIASRSTLRYNKLSNPKLKHFVTSLNKTSLLSWTCHANSVSRYASDELSLALVHSLLPNAWLSDKTLKSNFVPTIDDVDNFMRWFANYVGLSSSIGLDRQSLTNNVNSTSITSTGRRSRNNDKKNSRRSRKSNQLIDRDRLIQQKDEDSLASFVHYRDRKSVV